MTEKVIIFGSSGLLGRAISSTFLSRGYGVIGVDLNPWNIETAQNRQVHNLDFHEVDILEEKQLMSFFSKLDNEVTPIRKAVYAAYPKTASWGTSFEKSSSFTLEKNLYSVLGSTVLVSKYLIDYMKKNDGGNIVLFSSILGHSAPKFEHYEGSKVEPNLDYALGKAGVNMLVRYLAKLCANSGIRVNGVSPGGIWDGQDDVFVQNYKADCLSKGLLSPTDIVGAVDFLLSDNSSYVNGQNIVVDDGWSL